MEATLARSALEAAVARRSAAARVIADNADVVVGACREMADRFERGGRLVVFGTGGLAADAQHIAVEFLHPVIVGKRALPALALTTDVATVTGLAADVGYDRVFADQLRVVATPADIAVGLSTGDDGTAVRRGLAAAAEMGLLTVAITAVTADAAGTSADHLLPVPAGDARLVKEVVVTYYHLLWELVHVYVEQLGLLGTASDR